MIHGSRFFPVLMLLVGLAAFSAAVERPASGVTAVWANDGGDKVAQEELRATKGIGRVSNAVWDGRRVRITGAKNEVVAFNLVLEAPEREASGVEVKLSRLAGPGGWNLESRPRGGAGLFDWRHREIELFKVRYLSIDGLSLMGYEVYDERHIPKRMRRPWTDEGFGVGTFNHRPDHNLSYPDIAVPLELETPFSIAKGKSQSVWVDIYVPGAAAAGRYLGEVVVEERGHPPTKVPVELWVRDFHLPDVPTAKTMVVYSIQNVNERYLGHRRIEPGDPRETLGWEVRDRHFQLAHRHRISLIDTNCQDPEGDRPCDEWRSRLDGRLFTSVRGYDGPGIGVGNNVFSIGTYGTWGWKSEGETAMRKHTDAWERWFERHAKDTERFLFLIDESSDYAQIERWAKWMKDNPGPGGRLRSFATIPIMDADKHSPSLDVVASTLKVGIAPLWESLSTKYLGDERRRFFVYNGARPASGSFNTEDDGVALRQVAWAQYKKKIQRWFYWESTYYDNFQGGMGLTNVFRAAHTFGGYGRIDPVLGRTGWNYSNGEGVLFYPGTDRKFPDDSYGIPGPIASLRLKHWRQGIQDVEYLALAAAKDPKRTRMIVDRMVPRVLWEYGVNDPSQPTWVRTDISWPTDPDKWAAAREELAEIITGERIP